MAKYNKYRSKSEWRMANYDGYIGKPLGSEIRGHRNQERLFDEVDNLSRILIDRSDSTLELRPNRELRI